MSTLTGTPTQATASGNGAAKRTIDEVLMTGNSSSSKSTAAVVSTTKKARTKKPKLSEEEVLAKAVKKVTRAVQGQINAKLKWKNSFRYIKGTGVTKGGRCEVVCNDAKVFEEIFGVKNIKTSKDKSKLSCTFKSDKDVYYLPFHGKSYRFDRSTLRAPCSASLKDNTLTFSFKFSI